MDPHHIAAALLPMQGGRDADDTGAQHETSALNSTMRRSEI
jgi:hypothetical protein